MTQGWSRPDPVDTVPRRSLTGGDLEAVWAPPVTAVRSSGAAPESNLPTHGYIRLPILKTGRPPDWWRGGESDLSHNRGERCKHRLLDGGAGCSRVVHHRCITGTPFGDSGRH